MEQTNNNSQTVKVFLRVKPLPRSLQLSPSQQEAYEIVNSTTLITRIPTTDSTASPLERSVAKKFTFTEAFDGGTTQAVFFDRVIRPQLDEFLTGQNSVAMSHGTTNSGKSYTLRGTSSCPGMIPQSLEYIFPRINSRNNPCYKPLDSGKVGCLTVLQSIDEISAKQEILGLGAFDEHPEKRAYETSVRYLETQTAKSSKHVHFAKTKCLVWLSFAEIYNEKIYDLLCSDGQQHGTPLKLCTTDNGGTWIRGLRYICVQSALDAHQVFLSGQANLKIAATALNATSSRSHCIFTITLMQYSSENQPDSVRTSRFSFCDLAGSERAKKTLNTGERFRESQSINTSLVVLGKCLRAVCDRQLGKKHAYPGPFRESQLTRLFQPALSGREPLLLIANVNAAPQLYQETENVLNFAAFAKKIIIEPKPKSPARAVSRFSVIVANTSDGVTDWEDGLVEGKKRKSESYSDFSLKKLKSENLKLKETLEELYRQKAAVESERNVMESEMRLARGLTVISEVDELSAEKLATLTTALAEQAAALEDAHGRVEYLRQMLDEAKGDMLRLNADVEHKDQAVSELAERYLLEREKNKELEAEHENTSVLLAEKAHTIAELEEKLQREVQLRRECEARSKELKAPTPMRGDFFGFDDKVLFS